MGTISVMVKPASSACNLRCKYCFYADVAASREVAGHGVMKAETAELLAQRLADSRERLDRLAELMCEAEEIIERWAKNHDEQ